MLIHQKNNTTKTFLKVINQIAVQLSIDTFEKIEKILEDYALVQLMKENEEDEVLGIGEKYYNQLAKAK